MTRPTAVVVVTGTGTEVGKTWVAAATAQVLRGRGISVSARKPAQSFDPADGRPHDAEVLAEATGEDPDSICPRHRSYPLAMAPPMAAAALGLDPFTMDDLVREVRWDQGVDVGVIEGAGGPRSPLAADGDTVDLARAVAPDTIVLVADAGLGTINAVCLAVPPLLAIAPVVTVLNRYDHDDDLHRRNRAWLERDHIVVVGVDDLVDRLIGQRP